MSGDDARDPGGVPCYDIEGYRRHQSVFQPGEPVWITEKIDGCNFRAVWKGGLLHVGSHTRFKKRETPNLWWQSIKGLDLEDKLQYYPNLALFGEVYGQVGGMDYGVTRNSGTRLVLFDAMDLVTRRWFDVDEFLDFCQKLALPVVPTLYRGPWIPSLTQLADGMTTLGGHHIREGIVIKPVKERFCEELGGRCFLKLPGEKYLEKKHRR
jgi:RNA ligase (TIGR02306 family)